MLSKRKQRSVKAKTVHESWSGQTLQDTRHDVVVFNNYVAVWDVLEL